ncbi:MAG: hypothetical protein AM324_014935 [Candidatus Thorarchaeota archaeon SMTZ1-83]|nr:MAG: hypothetical protein AM324_16070 [Candidatus Thorarchaeota archaeon SMTZ1-83]
MNENEEFLDKEQKRFLKRHWKMTIVFAAVFVAAVVGAVLVFLWFIDTAQATGLLPSILGEFTVGYLVTFFLHVIFWELLLVASWVFVIILVIYFKWYMKLPEEERMDIIWIDGRWDLAFNSWTLNDWVFSWLWAVFWVMLIIGIPVMLYFLYWIRTEVQSES